MKLVALATAVAVLAGSASGGGPVTDPIVFGTAARVPEIAVRTGSEVERLTRNQSYDGLPAWSPDRKRIAYVSTALGDADIWVMSADGTRARRLAGARRADDLYPAWSPDGRLIAFARYQHGSGHVHVVRSDGKHLRRLTQTTVGVDNTMPRFSPDGRHIVFASTRRSGAHEIVRVRAADGGGTTFLTTGGNAMAPDYSPDGKRIAFATYDAADATVWTMRADGGDRRVLARHANRTVAFPRFSPDGRFVLYTVARSVDEQSESRLWRVGVGGNGRIEIGRGAEGDW